MITWVKKVNNVLFYKDFACKKRAMLNQFQLSKTRESATIEVLNSSHLGDALALHEATRAALPLEQKMFVLPQKPDYFEKFLAQRNGLMLGVRANGKLVAQLVVMGPLSLEEVIGKRAVTRNDIAFHHVGALDSIVAIKSMAVHPDFRGNELSQHILLAALELPLAQNADHIFAQISVDNARSWELFLKNGFGIVGAAVDPGDQKPRFILQKPADGFTFDMAPSADEVDPVEDFPAIMRLTQREALIGRIDEATSNGQSLRLAFSASTEISGPVPRVAGEK
jgi:ribosomal protein S18 acetylase RimI-like enzyme